MILKRDTAKKWLTEASLAKLKTQLTRYTWLRHILSIFFVSRLLLVIVGYVAEIALPSQTGQDFWQINSQNIFLDIWARWDSGYYLNIVQDGYFYRPGEKSTVAFFPLYPLFVDFLDSLLKNPVLAGIMVSNSCFIAALIFLYKLTHLELGEEAAKRAVTYLCIFPTSFFFSAVYTESTFLVFAVASLYFAKKKRWGWAGIMGMLCASSRIVGVIMWGVVGLEWLRLHGWTLTKVYKKEAWLGFVGGLKSDWHSLVALSAIPLGLFSYMVFLKQSFTDPIAFWSVQAAWGRESLGTIAILIRDIGGLLSQDIMTGQGDIWWHVGFDSLALLSALVISVFIWRKLGSSYALYVLLSALIPSLSSTQSLMRYFLVMFPIFMLLGYWGKHKAVHETLSLSFSVLAGLFFALFVNWYFVA